MVLGTGFPKPISYPLKMNKKYPLKFLNFSFYSVKYLALTSKKV